MLSYISSESDERLSADQKAILETNFYQQLMGSGAQLYLLENANLVPGISASIPHDLGHNFDLIATFASREGWAPISAQEPVIASLVWPDGKHPIEGLSVTEATKTPADYVLWMLVRMALRELAADAPEPLLIADAELSNRVLTDDIVDVDPDDFCEQLYEAHKIR